VTSIDTCSISRPTILDCAFGQIGDILFRTPTALKEIAAVQEVTWRGGGGSLSARGSLSEAWRNAGIYVGKILNGAKPAELPVMAITR
jgi:hypothetical protein